MKEINSIDLWTEPTENCQELYDGAFSDGWTGKDIPFDEYRVVRHCNCEISSNDENLAVGNKHNAIIFYKNGVPVRLAVAFEQTDIDACIERALSQRIGNRTLGEIFAIKGVKRSDIDLQEQPVYNKHNGVKEEISVGSCDRPHLFSQMVKGSWTEESAKYDQVKGDKFSLDNKLKVKYHLNVGDEEFKILHKGALYNSDRTQVIILQLDSKLKIIDFGSSSGI